MGDDGGRGSYETEAEATLRVNLDPTGVFLATSSSDRSIRVYDMLGGEKVFSSSCLPSLPLPTTSSPSLALGVG